MLALWIWVLSVINGILAQDGDAPVTIGKLNGTGIVKPTNGTKSFISDFLLSANDTTTDLSLSADIAAMTTTTGVSLTTVNGLKSICSGNLLLMDENSDVSQDNVVMIPCDDQTRASNMLDIIGDRNPACTIMYSESSQGCNFTETTNSLAVQLGTIFTMLTKAATQSIIDRAQKSSQPLSVVISPDTTAYHSSEADNGNTTSSGPTVAMAILYSITGIIAAIFLFVIISGAIRAHKHPERYGLPPIGGNPDNNVNGESFGNSNSVYANRAKGLARAVLDSIPLVTFRVNNNNNNDNRSDGDTAKLEAPATIKDDSIQLDTIPPIDAKSRNITTNDDDDDQQATATATNTTTNPETLPSSSSDNDSCPICFETFHDGDILRVLPCRHTFHAICVDPWLLNSSSQCPLCRVDLSISNNETVSEEPPNNNSQQGNNEIIIPPGYEVETSMFNRFLDIWNAQLLPKDARRRVLARFQQEADLRRQLRQRDTSMEEHNRNLWIRFVNSRKKLFHQRNSNHNAQ
jgi:hypothetical protein